MMDSMKVTDKLMTGLEGFITLVNDPNQIRAFYDLHKGLEDTQPMLSFEHYMLSIPEIAQLVEAEYEPAPYTLQQLSQLPVGSLGQVYATRMMADGLDANAIQQNAASSSLETGNTELERKARYLTRRRTMTHDIHHTVTNFSTELSGEVGLSGVYLVQMHHPVSLLYMCAALLHTMPAPEQYGQALHRLQEGLNMGWNAKNLLAQKWELGWERPLNQWQEELGITPAKNP